jgi:large subunit ribosomal protein L20
MSRVKKGVNALKRRRKVLSQTKGYRFGRSTKERQAKEALAHAGKYAFAHRKDKKSDRRAQWQIVISGALKEHNMSYSKFIGSLKKKDILVDRKILATLIKENPDTFKRLVAQAQ